MSNTKKILDAISDDDLRSEMRRRDELRKAIEEAERVAREQKEFEAKEKLLDLIRKNSDAFLLLHPTHQRTSCDDDRLINSGRECTRCALLVLLRDDWMGANSFEITIEIQQT